MLETQWSCIIGHLRTGCDWSVLILVTRKGKTKLEKGTKFVFLFHLNLQIKLLTLFLKLEIFAIGKNCGKCPSNRRDKLEHGEQIFDRASPL